MWEKLNSSTIYKYLITTPLNSFANTAFYDNLGDKEVLPLRVMTASTKGKTKNIEWMCIKINLSVCLLDVIFASGYLWNVGNMISRKEK